MKQNPSLYFFLLIIYWGTFLDGIANPIKNKVVNQAGWYLDYDVKFYKIDISVNDTNTYIAGNVTIVSEVKITKLDTFKFELTSKLSIDSVRLNNHKVSFFRSGDVVSAVLPSAQKQGQLISATIYYKGDVSSSGFFSPLSSQRDNYWKISITWSLSEPLGAKYWFPCKQYLPDKADSVWVFITVPNHCKAGSNGLLSGITPVGNNKTRYEWKSTYPIAYYLISIAVADYMDYSFYAKLNTKDSVFVQNFIYNRPNYLITYKSLIDKTGDYLVYYSKVFGKYPFYKEKYGHCVAPVGGGMEHQTMTTLSSFDNSLVMHELAHQWFGDLVTCSSWQDIWLNEGFASYCEYLVLDNIESHESAKNWMVSAHQSALQEPSGSVYVPLEDSEKDSRIFSYNLSYKKGASIIHVLRYELNNDSLFFNILHQYLNIYKDSVASARDFINVVNRLSGQNYDWFLDQWYYGKGFPIFDVMWKQDEDRLTIVSSQKTSDGSIPFFKAHYDLKLRFADGDTTIRLSQEKPMESFLIGMNRKVSTIVFDPNEWLIKRAKIEKASNIQSFDDYVEIMPNPFSEEMTLNFKTLPVADRVIKLIDMKGDTVFEFNCKKRNEVIVSLCRILPASYVLCVFEGNKKATRKVIKTK